MTVHRRCIAKVGNYCGCEENVLALYEKWKETVSLEDKILFHFGFFQHDSESDYNYQYNGDLYNIYSSLDNTDRQHEAQREIERVAQRYQANVTSGFDITQVRLIRTLGQGMNGAVSFIFF